MDSTENWLAFKKWWSQEGEGPSQNESFQGLFNDNPLLKTSMTLNRSMVVVVDLRSMDILFAAGDVESITGWDAETCLKGGVRYVFDKLHPADQRFGAIVGQLVNDYYKSLTNDQRLKFKAYWDWRYVKPNGQHSRVLANDIILKHDQDGNMILLLSLIREIGSKKNDKSNHLRMTNGSSNKIFEYRFEENGAINELECPSEREMEIMRGVSKGNSRKDIAEQCGISIDTVKTHCQNVYKKMRTNDSVETINLLQILHLL